MSATDTAMVLAAGLGTRMRPLTDNRPKPLIEVSGRTLIDRTLDRLEEAGIGRAIVNLHYLPQLLRGHLSSRNRPEIGFSDESDALLDTGGGVYRALPQLGSGPFLIANTDNVWLGESAFVPLLRGWQSDMMDALLLLAPRRGAVGYTRAGDFHLCPDSRPIRRTDAQPAPYVFTGVQMVSPRLFEGAPAGAFSMNLLWDRAIERRRAYALIHTAGWCDVGTPEGLRLAEAALSRAEPG